jgi:tRNA threonylcarbamoyladenosine biosynthesis protein TsaE
MPVPHTLELTSHSPAHTRRLGAQVGAALRPGDVLCLQGDLGAGKTTFVQGLAQGWGSLDDVSSPTFILVNVYRRDDSQLFHMDAYRLDSPAEAEQLDLDSMLADGALLIEWPERLGGLIPAEHLWITITHATETDRRMTLTAHGTRAMELLNVLAQEPGK